MARRFTETQHAWPFGAGHPSRYRHRRRRAGFRLLVLSVVPVALAACSGGTNRAVVRLPSTPVIMLRPTWGVVREPYLRLRSEAQPDAGITGHLRRSEVAEITAISPIAERVEGEIRYWYFLEGIEVSGWALDDALEAYGSEHRARNAAERLEARER